MGILRASRRFYHRLLLPIPVVGPVPGLVARGFRRPVTSLKAWLFTRDLRRLNDVLAGTDLAGSYVLSGGLLLGWAREGGLLRHDLLDADFGLRAEDLPRLEAATPKLREAGFRPVGRFVGNDGRVTELCFSRRHGWGVGRFDFFVAYPVGEQQLQYFIHAVHLGRPVELECRVPKQELVPFDFLGRTWLRHADFDLELTTYYGDWRTPQRHHDYVTDTRSAFCCRIWTHPDTSWTA